MKINNKNMSNLHIKSTLSELNLIDASFYSYTSVNKIRKFFHSNSNVPGVIIKKDDSTITLISRQLFFEHYSKPYGPELFSKKEMNFFLEMYEVKEPFLILPSTEEIMKASQIKFSNSTYKYEDPIVVEMINEEYKLLDSYNLVLSQIHISQLILQALREANEFKSDLMNIVAHDLKNPLNSIKGFTTLLEEYIPDTESEANEFFQMIKQSTQHMLDIVLELLNSTVIESGKMELKKITFDLCDLLSAVIYQNKALADQKEQIIKFNFSEDEHFICFGDSLKIRETIDNLVNNAVKYSYFKTNITVDLEKKDNSAIICIIDQGPGFSPEDLSKVFGKFQRLSAKPTGNENSTGLGLYIVKQIIDLHKGNINIESKENVGSKITIELPIIDND